MVQREATGIFLRFPTRTTQSRYVSAIITSTGSSSRSRSCSKGASIFVATASKNPGKSFARPSSEGMQLGIVAKQMLAGFVVSEPMKPSHSSVTTKNFTAKEDPRLVSDMDAVTVKPTYSSHVVAIPYPGGIVVIYASQITFPFLLQAQNFTAKEDPRLVSDMDAVTVKPTYSSHVVAIPYPGRGHVNPLMNFCNILASKQPDTLVTFVVTEEWLGLISSSSNNSPSNLQFGSIPNVIPSELVRNADPIGFVGAALTKMEVPFEELLDRFRQPLRPTLIVTDAFLFWAIGVGNRRNIPKRVMRWWITSPEFLHYVYWISRPLIFASNQYMLHRFLDLISWIPKAQYLILPSIYELESQVIKALKEKISIPVYAIGPAIPDFKLRDNSSTSSDNNELSYLQWLDRQPESSVLYVSLGSHVAVSSAQMDEIAAGLFNSGARFLWVARDKTSTLRQACGDKGLVEPWCDQLKVLCHSSVGGFWTHCGWNSVKEGILAGVPFLTFPIVADQLTHSKIIVEDWKIGWRMKKEVVATTLVAREEIAGLVQKFMDSERAVVQEMRRRSRELQQVCEHAIAEGGTSDIDLNAFIRNTSK
uniref:Anthocyanidin 3-O-glucosyltransferase n=1 Tax=Salix viminalis TaxID=40686 RepID=A0A6N2L2T3_SALVM